jgi:hypothetical protein
MGVVIGVVVFGVKDYCPSWWESGAVVASLVN